MDSRVLRAEINARELLNLSGILLANVVLNRLLDSLVVHLRALDVGRDRVRKESKLTDVCRRGDIDTLCVVVQRWVGRRERGRQAAVHGGVQELRALSEEQLSDVVQCKSCGLHRGGDSHGLEVTTVVYATGFAVNQGVVGR
jgi:hypothetical protein